VYDINELGASPEDLGKVLPLTREQYEPCGQCIPCRAAAVIWSLMARVEELKENEGRLTIDRGWRHD
jgi:hypothetical protein